MDPNHAGNGTPSMTGVIAAPGPVNGADPASHVAIWSEAARPNFWTRSRSWVLADCFILTSIEVDMAASTPLRWSRMDVLRFTIGSGTHPQPYRK